MLTPTQVILIARTHLGGVVPVESQPGSDELARLINEFDDIFAEKLPLNMSHSLVDEPGNTIPLAPGSKPTFRKPFRMSPAELGELRKQVAEFLAQGLIETSSSPYGAPVLFIKKKTG